MQRSSHLQRLGDLLFVRIIELGAAFDIPRDFPPLGGILEEECVIESKFARCVQGKSLCFAVDDLFGSIPRMPIYVADAFGREQSG